MNIIKRVYHILRIQVQYTKIVFLYIKQKKWKIKYFKNHFQQPGRKQKILGNKFNGEDLQDLLIENKNNDKKKFAEK